MREIPGFDYASLMDDDTNILFNVHLGELNGARLKWMFTDITYVPRYMPLGWLSYNIGASWGDLSPWPLHVASVVFHILNTLIVFFCLRLLFERFQPESKSRDRALAAGLGALLWALHPLRVEPVAWCSGLIYIEGGFFALLSVYARLRELQARRAMRGRPNRWFALSALLFACSLLTYPIALALPAVFLLLDYAWFKGESTGMRGRLRAELALISLLALGALAVTLVARRAIAENGVAPISLEDFGVIARIFQAGYVWAVYLWRTIWPFGLTPIMDAIFVLHVRDVRIWAPLPVLLFLSVSAWRHRRTAPYFVIGWLAYLLWMVPFLGLTEHPHVPADRYSYLASALLSLTLGFWLLRLQPLLRSALLIVGAAAVICCSALSVRQARLWRNPVIMHEHVLQHLNDEDLRNITLARIAKLRFLAGDVREGRAQVSRVYSVAPRIAGVARSWKEMQPVRPLSPEEAARPLQEWGTAPWTFLHNDIAAEHLREGRPRDALVRLNLALTLSPNYIVARFRRAFVRLELDDLHGAAHDWLVLSETDTARTLSPEGMRFLAAQISAGFRAQGDGRLASGLLRRAQPSPLSTGIPKLPVPQ